MTLVLPALLLSSQSLILLLIVEDFHSSERVREREREEREREKREREERKREKEKREDCFQYYIKCTVHEFTQNR